MEPLPVHDVWLVHQCHILPDVREPAEHCMELVAWLAVLAPSSRNVAHHLHIVFLAPSFSQVQLFCCRVACEGVCNQPSAGSCIEVQCLSFGAQRRSHEFFKIPDGKLPIHEVGVASGHHDEHAARIAAVELLHCRVRYCALFPH